MRTLAALVLITWGLHLGPHGFIYDNGGPYGRPQPGVFGTVVGKVLLPHPWIRVSW